MINNREDYLRIRNLYITWYSSNGDTKITLNYIEDTALYMAKFSRHFPSLGVWCRKRLNSKEYGPMV